MSDESLTRAQFLMDDDPETQESGVLDELSYSHFSIGDLFWVRNSGKRVPVLTAGSYVSVVDLEKFKASSKLELDEVCDKQFIEEGLALLDGLDAIPADKHREEYRAQIRKEFLEWIAPVVWTGQQSKSLLDLVILFEKKFYALPQDLENDLASLSVDLFKRSGQMAALMVLGAITIGYLGPAFLKELYNTCLVLDLGLLEHSSYDLLHAMEAERRSVGNGDEFLKKLRGSGLSEVATPHVEAGLVLGKEKIKETMIYPGLIGLIERHHERLSGDGYPHELNGEEMTDLERLLVVLESMLSFEPDAYRKNDALQLVRNIIVAGNRQGSLAFARMAALLESAFEEAVNGTEEDFLEIAGL